MFVPRSLVLASAIVMALAAADAVAADAVPMQTLGRSFAKLSKDKKLKIAYFGGSITASSSVTNSWRTQTTAWFQSQNPQAKITEVNAAAEGGSEYGAFRFRKDIMEQDPDLLFVEFAVDDADHDEQRALRSVEGIVRQYLTANPWAEIVFIYTTDKKLSPGYDRSSVPKAVGYHQVVAKHYGIPAIDVGSALAEATRTGKGTWESLTIDGTQPNEAGTTIYSREISAFLAAQRNVPAAEPLVSLPDPLTKDPFSGAHLQKGTTLYAPGWRKVTMPTDALPPYLEADAVGAELEHTFTGSTVGMLLLVGPDCGDIEWSIDDGPPQRLSSWDAQTGARAKFVILADNLSSGREHTLTIRVHSEKSPQSTGNRVRIAAIMMHCDC